MMRTSTLVLALSVVSIGFPASAQEPKPRAVYEGHASHSLCVEFSPDGKILASAGPTTDGHDSCLILRDAASGKELKVIKVRKEPTRSICFSPDSKSIALAGGYSLIAEVWDVATGEKRLAIDYPKKRSDSGLMTKVAFTPDGKTITTASSPNGAIHFFDAKSGERTGGVGPGTTLAYSPDGKFLAAGRQGPIIHLWDVATLKQLSPISPIESNMRVIVALAFSPDNKTLAVGGVSLSDSDTPIRMWDVATGKEGTPLKGHTSRLSHLAFCPGTNILASASADKTVRFWDTTTNKQISSIGFWALSMAVSPDGKTLAAGSMDGKVRLWDVPDSKKVKE
jgi:WD40 repeat protein